MKIKVTFTVDTEDGEYEMKFDNISSPGEPMSFEIIKKAFQKITEAVERDIMGMPKWDEPIRGDN